MPRSRSESSRLLSETGRCMCLAMTGGALVCVSVPGALPSTALYVAVAACLVVIGVSSVRMPRSRSHVEPFAVAVVAIAAILLIGLLGGLANPATSSALVLIGGGCVASVTISVGIDRRSLWLLIAAFVFTIGALGLALAVSSGPAPRAIGLTLIGWMFCVSLASWLGRMAPQTVRRITSMSRAYSAERTASEMEARRRQDARLLHDTVLATLTLLAHSGVGVSERALREQAAEDAALLRQLRMGMTPEPSASGDYNLKPVDESTLGNTLESVKQRFRRIGLEVNWHGTGHVLLPSETLDAFLLALAECLENVRRHSGVDEAHVTITDDEATVRAMVTDAGVGFDLEAVAPGRLGFAESIVARLRDVGGNARLFSSPGSGTTVVLEVPK
ncbi:sensor histidine kinase [Rathayibacter soli]|uniref:sensor histidine kinase n=1 Tax=Rathayibacter soli TaxID=3144168 RepID=UPI003908021A